MIKVYVRQYKVVNVIRLKVEALKSGQQAGYSRSRASIYNRPLFPCIEI